MPKLTVEIQDPTKPLLFLVGDKNPLIPYIISEFQDQVKIAQISPKTPPNGVQNPTSKIYHVDPTNAALVKNLKEKIDYAIVFCEGVEVKQYLGDIFEKFSHDKTKVVIICDLKLLHEFSDVAASIKTHPTFSFIISSDIYSEDPTFNPSSVTAKLIDDAVFGKQVVFEGNELKPIFPIYFQDAIIAISKLILGPLGKDKFFYLFYNHPQTIISAVHILQRREPDLKIDYKEQETHAEYSDFGEIEDYVNNKLLAKPVFFEKYLNGFEKSIDQFIKRGPIKKEEDLPPSILAPKRIIVAQKKKISLFAKALVLAFILFVIIEVATAVGSFLFIKNAIASYKRGDLIQASKSARGAKSFFDVVNPVGEIVVKGAASLGATNIDSDYQMLSQILNIANIAAVDSDNLTNLTNGITEPSLGKAISDAYYLYFSAQELSSKNNNSQLKNISYSDLTKILSLAQVIPQVLGFDYEKHYLLLFQNNGELRPTGGFIGSVGEVTVKSGKLISFDIHDVYEYDGQLKNHIEPHYIVRRFLQPHLYLRDSNFNPDFGESAATAAFIYNLETGKKVDGVIAINFEAVKEIIGEIGPIELTSFKKTLRSDNTFNFLQETIDNNFFPGSSAKRDVLQALFDKIMLTLENKSKSQKALFILPKLMSEKNILFAFSKPSIQNAFSATGFAGEYKDSRNFKSGQINDFLAINEANIGVNKANISVTRTTSYSASLTPSKLQSKVTHNLNNQSDDYYKPYLRIYTPLGSKITAIKIDGKVQNIIPAVTDFKVYEKKNFQAPTAGLEVDESVQNQKTVFGFIATVSPKTAQQIDVEYENGANIPRESIIDYSLFLIKQPGTLPYSFALNIIYGSIYTPKEVTDATLENGVVVINRRIEQDNEFNAEFLRR